MRGWLLGVLIVAVGVAGCIGADDLNPFGNEPVEVEEEEAPEVPTEEPAVVIAVIDTGINFYHEEYQAPDRWTAEDPGENATAQEDDADLARVHEELGLGADAVPLTLDEGDWDQAVEEDWEGLMEMERETLYTFPGTKILGAISFNDQPDDWPLILDRPGSYTHGTMTTSRAVGNTVSIGGDDPGIWLVKVQGFDTAALEWVAQQDWIDIASISAGLSPLAIFPAAPNALDEGAIETYQELAREKPFFASSGNGVANVGAAGYPSWLRGASGAPDVVSVGATDNDHMTQWHNQDPYIAADGCSNPAAPADTTDEVTNSGGGTSSATPFSAGGGAAMLLEARRMLNDTEIGPRFDEDRTRPDDAWDSQNSRDAQVILAEGDPPVDEGPLADGVFTMREFKDVLYHTALETPVETDSDGEHCANGALPPDAVPENARFPFIGYGEVNALSIEHALDVLSGDEPLPDRPLDDWHYERAHSHKQTFVTEDPAAPGTPPVDDPQR